MSFASYPAPPYSAGSGLTLAGTTFAVKPPSRASADNSTGGGTSTTAATLVMAGQGIRITPNVTGDLLIVVSVWLSYSGVRVGNGSVGLRRGTGASPAAGDAVTGTVLQAAMSPGPNTVSSKLDPITFEHVVTGLAIGTAIWVDVCFSNGANAGQTTFVNSQMTATELMG